MCVSWTRNNATTLECGWKERGSNICLSHELDALALLAPAAMANHAILIVVHKLALRGSSALARLQEGARAAVVFCQQGSTTMRCVQVAQLAPVKGSKEKPGGQLRTDNKKPIVALAAAPCQKLEVLVLYVDGSLSSCTCSPATRVMATRWCIAVDPGTAALHQVGQRAPITPDPAILGDRTGMLMQTCGVGRNRSLCPAKSQRCLNQRMISQAAPAIPPQESWPPHWRVAMDHQGSLP